MKEKEKKERDFKWRYMFIWWWWAWRLSLGWNSRSASILCWSHKFLQKNSLKMTRSSKKSRFKHGNEWANLWNMMHNTGLVSRAKRVNKLSKNESHERLRQSIGSSSYCPYNHQNDIDLVCKTEQLVQWHLLILPFRFCCTTTLAGRRCFFISFHANLHSDQLIPLAQFWWKIDKIQSQIIIIFTEEIKFLRR